VIMHLIADGMFHCAGVLTIYRLGFLFGCFIGIKRLLRLILYVMRYAQRLIL